MFEDQGGFCQWLIRSFIRNPAEWMQALGSIIALGVAIGIPWWQQRSRMAIRREDRVTCARSLALLVRDDLVTLSKRLNKIRAQWPAGGVPPAEITYDQVGDFAVEKSALADYLKIGSALEAQAPNLHALDKAAKATQRVVFLSYRLKSLFGDIETEFRYGLGTAENERREAEALLDEARTLSAVAIRELDSLLE